jgi:hypothetical protein
VVVLSLMPGVYHWLKSQRGANDAEANT